MQAVRSSAYFLHQGVAACKSGDLGSGFRHFDKVFEIEGEGRSHNYVKTCLSRALTLAETARWDESVESYSAALGALGGYKLGGALGRSSKGARYTSVEGGD